MRRPNQSQMKKLLDLLSKDGVLVEGNVSYSDTTKQTFWKTIALQLNSVEGGVFKTTWQWCKMWSDWKTNTKKKVNILLQNKQYHNGKKVVPLTSLELRLLKMINYPLDDNMDVLGLETVNEIHTPEPTTYEITDFLTEGLEGPLSPEHNMSSDEEHKTAIEFFGQNRVILDQMNKLLDLLSEEGVLFQGKVSYSRTDYQTFWKHIADQLNSVEGGGYKNSEKWCKMWLGWKNKTKRKAKILLRKKQHNNGKKVTPLTSLELRLLKMIDYPLDYKPDVLDLEMVNKVDIPQPTQEEKKGFLTEGLEVPPSPEHNMSDEEDNTAIEFFGQSRVKKTQLKKLLDLLSEDGVLVHGNVSYSSTNYETFWKRIASQLNSVKGGGYKTFGKWCKMWADWKNKTKKKVNFLLQKKQYHNGQKVTPLTSLELRLLKMIGYPLDDKMHVLGLKMNNHSDEISDYQVENVDIAAPIPIHFESTGTNVSTRKRTNSYDDKSDDTMGYNFAKKLKQVPIIDQDEFDIFALNVASELRKTRDLHSVLMAKHYINNILVNARMGTYRKDANNKRKTKVKTEYDHNSDVNDDENNASEGTFP